jgi:hypothetical protein
MNGFIVVTDPAGTASRPLRIQRAKTDLVERVDYVTDGVFVTGDQPGDRGDRRPGRRRHDDQCPAHPY